MLAAVALRTSRIRLGMMITPKVARETIALDHLSDGRFILGVDLGDPAKWDYSFFGEDPDPRYAPNAWTSRLIF